MEELMENAPPAIPNDLSERIITYQIAIEKIPVNKADRNFRVSKKLDFQKNPVFLTLEAMGKLTILYQFKSESV
ncbi:MAG: hypothetical protein R2941_07100 [Desulfobacterales bacterium]